MRREPAKIIELHNYPKEYKRKRELAQTIEIHNYQKNTKGKKKEKRKGDLRRMQTT